MIRSLAENDRITCLAVDAAARRLLLAVVRLALHDAVRGTARHGADAFTYLDGPNFESDTFWLNLDPTYIRSLINQHESEMQRLFTDEQIHALYTRYINEHITLEQLGRENNVSGATLSRIFSRAGFDVRLRGLGRPRAPISVRSVQQATGPAQKTSLPVRTIPPTASPDNELSPDVLTTLRETNTLLANLGDHQASAHGVIRLKLDIDLRIEVGTGQEAK